WRIVAASRDALPTGRLGNQLSIWCLVFGAFSCVDFFWYALEREGVPDRCIRCVRRFRARAWQRGFVRRLHRQKIGDVERQLSDIRSGHDIDLGANPLMSESEFVHRFFAAIFFDIVARPVIEGAARTNRGAHRFLARTGTVATELTPHS